MRCCGAPARSPRSGVGIPRPRCGEARESTCGARASVLRSGWTERSGRQYEAALELGPAFTTCATSWAGCSSSRSRVGRDEHFQTIVREARPSSMPPRCWGWRATSLVMVGGAHRVGRAARPTAGRSEGRGLPRTPFPFGRVLSVPTTRNPIERKRKVKRLAVASLASCWPAPFCLESRGARRSCVCGGLLCRRAAEYQLGRKSDAGSAALLAKVAAAAMHARTMGWRPKPTARSPSETAHGRRSR